MIKAISAELMVNLLLISDSLWNIPHKGTVFEINMDFKVCFIRRIKENKAPEIISELFAPASSPSYSDNKTLCTAAAMVFGAKRTYGPSLAFPERFPFSVKGFSYSNLHKRRYQWYKGKQRLRLPAHASHISSPVPSLFQDRGVFWDVWE